MIDRDASGARSSSAGFERSAGVPAFDAGAMPSVTAARRSDVIRLSSRVDLVSVRLLGAVCDAGSITKAAESEPFTPSAISKRIRELEDVFGVPLLIRQREGVVPTAAGRVVAGVWAELEPILRDLPERLVCAAAPRDDRVRIVCDKRIARFVALDRLSLAAARSLASRVSVVESLASRLVDTLAELDADIGVSMGVAAHSAFSEPPEPGFIRREVVLPRAVFVLRADHPLADRERLSALDAADFPLAFIGECAHLADAMRSAPGVARLEIEDAFWAREPGAALDHLDVEPGPQLLVAPYGVCERIRRFPSLRTLPCPEPWAAIRLTILVRSRGRPAAVLDEVLATVFGVRGVSAGNRRPSSTRDRQDIE